MLQQHPKALFPQVFLVKQAVADDGFAGAAQIIPGPGAVNRAFVHPGQHGQRFGEIPAHVFVRRVFQPAVEFQRRQFRIIIIAVIVILEYAAALQIKNDGVIPDAPGHSRDARPLEQRRGVLKIGVLVQVDFIQGHRVHGNKAPDMALARFQVDHGPIAHAAQIAGFREGRQCCRGRLAQQRVVRQGTGSVYMAGPP